MEQYEDFYNLKFLNQANTMIQAEVENDTFVCIEQGVHPEMFNRCISGLYGSISPFEGEIYDPLQAYRASLFCSRLQAKAVLMNMGLLDQTEEIIMSMSPIVQLAWREAVEFKRTSPLIIQLASLITLQDGSKLSETDLDKLFEDAKTLEF